MHPLLLVPLWLRLWLMLMATPATPEATPPPGAAEAANADPFERIEVPVRRLRAPLHRMGFVPDDETYLRLIPREARMVPRALLDGRLFFASDGDLLCQRADPHAVTAAPGVLSFRAYETSPDGDYVLRKVRHGTSGAYDQWFLLDVPRHIRGVISIHRVTGRIWYFQVEGFVEAGVKRFYMVGSENCYSCHPSGLRTIVPRVGDPEADGALLAELNQQILDAGVADHGDTVDLTRQGPSLEACADCHDGETRGRLYPTHLGALRFKLGMRLMPPGGPLSAAEAAALIAPLPEQRAKALGIDASCREAVARRLSLRQETVSPELFARKVQRCFEEARPGQPECVTRARSAAEAEACFPPHL